MSNDAIPILFGPPLDPGTEVDLELHDDGEREFLTLGVPRGNGVIVEAWLRKALLLEAESSGSERKDHYEEGSA